MDSQLFNLRPNRDIQCLIGSSDGGAGVAEPPQSRAIRRQAKRLLSKLPAIPPGREGWAQYQTLCGEILEFLFCPPLEVPRLELSNDSGINRRDIILPNYAPGGFWADLRTSYTAHFIVVDAKNYARPIGKPAIVQLANYLQQHGAGLFGMILTRHPGSKSATITRKEEWQNNKKLIIELTDADLHKMLCDRMVGGNPEALIRQRIEDFRLGF